MYLPPIVERELRVATRKLDVRRKRWKLSLIGATISAIFLLLGVVGGEGFIRSVHPFLFLAAIYYSVISTFYVAGNMFVQERQEQTLGFLFLAGMTMPEIFVTKIAGTFLIAITTVLCFIPFMAIPFLAGGVSFDVFWATVWCLPNLLVLTLALCTFASVCSKEDSAATSIAQIVAGAICLVTPALHWAARASGVKLSNGWLLISPAYGPWLIFNNFKSGSPSQFWWNSGATFGWSIAFFILAAIFLRHTWRAQTISADTHPWQKIIPRWLTRSEKWKRKRVTLLERNPFAWLSSYDRYPERLAWAIVAGTAAIWLVGWWLIGEMWVSVPNFFITATVVNIELTGVVLYAAAKRIGEDRRSGAIELLLVTPMTPMEIVRGQIEALRHQFRSVAWGTALINLALALIGLTLRAWTWQSLVVYVIAWTILIVLAFRLTHRNALRAFYAALVSGRPSFAMWKSASLGNIASWWWIFFNGKSLFSHANGFPTGNWFEMLLFAFLIPLAFLVTMIYRRYNASEAPYSEAYLRAQSVVQDFRLIVQSPVPAADDKRFKNWQPTQQFPIHELG